MFDRIGSTRRSDVEQIDMRMSGALPSGSRRRASRTYPMKRGPTVT